MKCALRLILIIIGCATLSACDDGPHSADIPNDVSYSIINAYADRSGIKRSLDVRLNKKISETTLRAIALELRSQDSRSYDRTFITYYLPEATPGTGGWATTHFNPNLEVNILGLTIDEERQLVSEVAPANHTLIGRWVDESPFVSSRITIFERDGSLFLEHQFKDGSINEQEIVELETQEGRRFEMIAGSRTGDHWVIISNGNLQIRDDDGLITTARNVQ